MTAVAEAALSERRMVAHGLRLWCRNLERSESGRVAAAVELVIGAHHGEFADPGWPWVVEGDPSEPLGLFRLDADAMAAWDSGRPEHPVMDFVEALAGGRPVRRLPELLRLLDQHTRRLVLAAFYTAALADAEVAVYAFGGDPWPLVDDATPAWRFWPTCVLDMLDRPAVAMRPRLKVAGDAR
jgi:hypothetical protein